MRWRHSPSTVSTRFMRGRCRWNGRGAQENRSRKQHRRIVETRCKPVQVVAWSEDPGQVRGYPRRAVSQGITSLGEDAHEDLHRLPIRLHTPGEGAGRGTGRTAEQGRGNNTEALLRLAQRLYSTSSLDRTSSSLRNRGSTPRSGKDRRRRGIGWGRL